MIATGARKIARKIPGDFNNDNISYLETRKQHKELREGLEEKKIKKLAILGLNMESLELAATIRREFPKVHITVLDENRENMLMTKYGADVANAIVE